MDNPAATAASERKKNIFANKNFYLDIRYSVQLEDSLKRLIKEFEGRVEQFLDKKAYLVTDVPEENWPNDRDADGADPFLTRAKRAGIKLMSANKCLAFCKNFLSSNWSEDDDDENKHNTRDLRPPFLKCEDLESKFKPICKEFNKWPEPNLDGPIRLSKSIFCDDMNILSTTSATNQQHNNQHTHQQHPGASNHLVHHISATIATTATNKMATDQIYNKLPQAKRKRLGPYCELCDRRVESLQEHIEKPQHKLNIENCDWKDVHSVIESLPTFETVTRPVSNGSTVLRLTDLSRANGVQQFVPLHDIVSQIVFASRQSDEGRGPSL